MTKPTWEGLRVGPDGYVEAGLHPQEERRMSLLRELQLVEKGQEQAFDAICQTAAEVFKASYSIVTIVDSETNYLKATYGIDPALRVVPRPIGLCAVCVCANMDGLEITDTREDEKYRNNPMVVSGLHVRYYTSFLLRDPTEGLPLGALCVCHDQPMKAQAWQIRTLRTLTDQLIMMLRFQKETMAKDRLLETYRESEKSLTESLINLKETTENRSVFLTEMTHEIRTPISAIVGMTDLLLETTMDNQQQEYAESIRSSSSSLLSIINDVLDFTKADHGKMLLEDNEFSLTECLESSMSQVAHQAGEKNLDMGYNIDPHIDSEHVRGDRMKLQQVIVNLLSNAVKFTSEGQVELRAEKLLREEFNGLNAKYPRDAKQASVCVEENGKTEPLYLKISVRDTGIGLTSEQASRLFKPFTQADESIMSKYGGTGLGLSLCSKMSQLMGGTSWVESKKDEGSTFCATFSLKTPTRSFTPLMPETPKPFALIASPYRVASQTISNMLLRCGKNSNHVTTTEEATAYLKSETAPTLCFVSISLFQNMAEANDFLHYLRSIDDPPYVVLLYLSHERAEERALRDLVDGSMLRYVKSRVIRNLALNPLPQHNIPIVSPNSANPLRFESSMPINPSHLRILLAEDNKMNRMVLLKMLGHLGHKSIDIALNGSEVVEMVQKKPYHVVFMDVHMPIVSGVEATRQLRQLPTIHQPLVICTTASTCGEELEQCFEVGMDTFLRKPITLEAMKELMQGLQIPSVGL